MRELARENAMAAADRLADAPAAPAAVFVNDVTIGYQHASGEVEPLLDYCDTAETAVLNAFESDELGTDDPVSVRERDVVQRLRTWADRTIALGD
jgi:methenyltetrahydromethanopterin cyclohydrolase